MSTESVTSNVVDLDEWRRARALDRSASSSRVTAMSATTRLPEPDWRRLKAQVSAYAFRRTGRRSWEHAEDLAQSAIVQHLTRPAGWDPAHESLLKHLCKRVIGLASNEWHRKRSSFEVAMRWRELAALPVDDGGQPADEVLDQRRLAAQFRARLEARLAGDETALTIIVLMTEGFDTPAALQKASGLPLAQIREARRRIFYHAKLVAEELGEAMDAELDASPAEEDEEEDAR